MSYVTRRFKCPVVGTGKPGNPFRPALIPEQAKTTIDDKTLKSVTVYPEYYKHKGITAIYFPRDPPYEYCMVEIVLDEKAEVNPEHITAEYADESEFKVIVDYLKSLETAKK